MISYNFEYYFVNFIVYLIKIVLYFKDIDYFEYFQLFITILFRSISTILLHKIK